MNTRLYKLMALLLLTAATANAQVKIYGNVYGGGEKAQVIEPNIESVKDHIIQDADLATLFTKQHTYTTYVRLGEKAEVYGRTFGGGMGHEDSKGESAGRVTGQTDVVLDGATVWSEIFGGGENADVRGNTLVHFKKGKAGHNAFGGGLGLLGGTDDLPDNQRTPLASADIKLIPANYDLIVDDTEENLTILKGYYNQDGTTDVKSSNWLQDKITGESFVVFDGDNESYTHYEFKEARTFAVVDGKPVVTSSPQYDPSNPSQLFSINHNIYGGGMTASKIEGKTFVHINYGMVNQEMMDYTVGGKKVWSNVYNSIANAQFCVFGGGYGYHSQVNGDTYVTMDIMGSGQYKYINEFTQWFATEGKAKYHWDTNTGTPENIYKAADESTWSHGAPGRSAMDIIGGGYNGKVLGTTHITIGGDVIVRKVYGGGYYASVGNTDVNVKSGIFNRVYGGGLIGNVYGKATLNVGQQGTTDNIIKHNTHLMVKDAIYGGNDVSGTVGTTVPQIVTAANGVKYNVYSPVDDDNHGVRLNIYGGLVLGDVFGAGNGNHPGYTNPDNMGFDLSQHPSENYRTLANAGTKGTKQVYKYRPRTGRVVMNLQGNAGTDFNDEPLVDKVRIWGRTFGGGNSCNVGIWDGTKDDEAEVYSEGSTSWHPGDNFSGEGTITLNIGNHVQLGNRNDSHERPNGLFMGNNGEHMVTQNDAEEMQKYYHYYWNGSYTRGFNTNAEGGDKAFYAFVNNILTWTDNVSLNIAVAAKDVWMSNFVGGGYRGSMKAKTATGRFAYALPVGVTIGHAVVGGAFNAHITYSENDTKVYNFDGGMMGHESKPQAAADGARCGNVKANGSEDFTRVKDGSEPIFDKDKALVYLNLRNRMEPIVETTKVGGQDKKTVHGGIVYGGCFLTGYVDGDSWVDYRCSLSPLCTDADFFDKTKADLYEKVDNIADYNALNVYGAGYGEDSHIMGDAYLRILHNGKSDNSYDYPFIYNAFGGGNNGTVAGNTNVYFNVGSKGTVLGSLYAGGYKGTIRGNTKLELAGGLIINAYGGSREANIGGATHVWAYDGELRDGEDEPEVSKENAPLLIGNLYGGNDVSGTISGTKLAKWTEPRWNEATTEDKKWTNKAFTTCVQIGGTEHSTRGYPMIGNVYAGGNGIDTKSPAVAPDVASSLLEVSGGTVLRAFGGGNKATVTSDACIFTQATDNTFATFEFTDYYKTVLNHTVLNNINSGYKWEGTRLILDPYHIVKLYGGNNLASMAIQPTWNLAAGSLEYVYSGGNLGDMTYPHGIKIDVTSPEIRIKNLFGGCRMADVKPTAIAGQDSEFETYWSNTANYGATVNCTGGYITNVYGGNDISGTVAHGTKVVIDGAVDNDVYCAGNGNYLYKWDATVDKVTEVKEGDDVIYKVPAMEMFGGSSANDTQKLLTINAYRPSVERSALDIAGVVENEETKVAFVKGNVYCGGNASTVTGNGATKLNLGSHINVHGLFMGSDGADFSKQEAIDKFAKLNGFDMTATTDFAGLTYGENEGQVPATSMTAAETKFYPNMLALYMKAVEMQSLPTLSYANNMEHAYIGTWCGGGNRGSMTAQSTVNLEIPSTITIYDKVVAGCMDANVKYVGSKTLEDTGGYYRPLTSGTTKLNYTINAKFLPRYMSVPEGMDKLNPEGENFLTARGNYFLYENAKNNQYGVGNNIYGGCYESGDVLGDVVLNVNSNLLEEPLKVKAGSQPNREKLNNASRNEVAAFNVYGAGMGMNSNVWGNVTINMNGNANNVYGGGRSGTLIGNATINMLNGIVYRHIIGGSDAGNMYGSTQIAVGKPTMYKAPSKAEYALTRADEGLANSIKLAEGDIISEALYDILTDKTGFTSSASDHTLNSIYIGGGIYGGGYALATGSTVFAGSTTLHKYTDKNCPKNPTTGELDKSLVGYGGNATIMVKDNDAADNITISTIVPTVKTGMTSTMGYFTCGDAKATKTAVGDTEYAWNHQPDAAPVGGTDYYDLTGQGGIFGDGHLSLVEGFRSADIQGYGYATYTPQQPKLLNTFQRLDVARVKDCCIMLQGARDFASNTTDATIYSASRIRELQLGSSISAEKLTPGTPSGASADSQHTTEKMRNYLGLYKNVHFLGALKSDVAFTDAMYDQEGAKNSETYQSYKTDIITNYYPADTEAKSNAFRTRNLGTAKNMIGINNGYTLKIQKETNDNSIVYGPVVGVTEVKLLTLVRGEGGGYVYAANKHDNTSNFLNTSGNLVFQSTGTGQDIQYIVDDCFPNGFNETAQGDCHYWYVEGDKYWFNGTITGYTYDDAEIKFNLNNNDQIISLSGTKSGSALTIQSIEWQHVHSASPYNCDIQNKLDNGYTFALSASNSGEYNTDGAYSANMVAGALTGTVDVDDPRLAIQLTDNVKNNAAKYYDQHLKEPCKAKIVLTSSNGKTYTMNLDVIYLKGPSVEGTVVIDNCALPGEYIHAHVDGLRIETNDGMPVTGTKWQVKHGGTTEDIARMNTTEIDNSIIDLKALYRHNGYELQYVVVANGVNFPVSVADDATMKTLLVHNYHKMAEVQNRQANATLKLDPQAGARIYISDDADLAAFAQWINDDDKTTEGIHFYLQNNLKLPADWNITKEFNGTLHGDGYVLDASGVTGTNTLFGDKLTGTVYNLGITGGQIASTGTKTNCYDNSVAEADLMYGKKAYELSHNDALNDYVTEYYAGDDWRYARTTADNSTHHTYLRTSAPAYGSVSTAHTQTHTTTAYTPVVHDYLFFGQLLTPDGAICPQHIDDAEATRVYETEGYYQSSTNDGFYYNKKAWALQPTLTAVDFTEVADADMPESFDTGADVTRNLLVYNNNEVSAFAAGRYSNDTPESNIKYHGIVNGSIRFLHLVDKQDFNAPKQFSVSDRIWYERLPQSYRNVSGGYDKASAWEGIVLPFTATKVSAEMNGEISHFYGSDNVHHEYWLRGFKSVTADGTHAAFVRPGTSGDDYFVDANQTTAARDYTYPANLYFTTLYGYNTDNAWYKTSHTYAGYTPLTAGVPYIVAFPGDDFYEFSMESYYRDDAYSRVVHKQKAIFETGATTIPVTDDGFHNTTAGNYTHAGTFVGKTGVLTTNAEGTAFKKGDALPFRTYMTSSAPAQVWRIDITSNLDTPHAVEPDDENADDALRQLTIWTEGLDICVESTESLQLPVYNVQGTKVGTMYVQPGITSFTVNAPGVYIVAKQKLLVR